MIQSSTMKTKCHSPEDAWKMGLAASTAGLVLILLLLEARETLGGVQSLCFSLTVRAQALPGQPWCEAQGSVDGKPFLQFDSDSSKTTPLGLLGEKAKDTKAWTDVTQSLEVLGRELRMVLLVTKLENSQSRDPPSLQGKLTCERAAGQCTGASWEFSVNGQKALINTMNMTWTVIDAGARGIKEEWESNQNLAEYFRRISTAICCHWLKDFLEHWEKTVMPTEIPLETPDTGQPPSNTTVTRIITLILIPILLIGFIITVIIIMIHRKHSVDPDGASCDHKRITSLDQHLMTETCHLTVKEVSTEHRRESLGKKSNERVLEHMVEDAD